MTMRSSRYPTRAPTADRSTKMDPRNTTSSSAFVCELKSPRMVWCEFSSSPYAVPDTAGPVDPSKLIAAVALENQNPNNATLEQQHQRQQPSPLPLRFPLLPACFRRRRVRPHLQKKTPKQRIAAAGRRDPAALLLAEDASMWMAPGTPVATTTTLVDVLRQDIRSSSPRRPRDSAGPVPAAIQQANRSQSIAIHNNTAGHISQDPTTDCHDDRHASEAERLYDFATWRMYERITDHRRRFPLRPYHTQTTHDGIPNDESTTTTTTLWDDRPSPDARDPPERFYDGEVFELEL